MTRRTRRLYLSGITAFSAVMATLFLATPSLWRESPRPKQLEAMLQRLDTHPADGPLVSAVSERALDSSLTRRVEVWRASYELAQHLAPLRTNASVAFVRGGLFHWFELEAEDRARVLAVAAPLLRDPALFAATYANLFELTHDFAYLRRNAPETPAAVSWLKELALANGLFEDYRSLRELERKERIKQFESLRATATAADLIDLFPAPPEMGDEAMARAILEEIDRKPAELQRTSSRTETLALFAMRHGIQPLRALEPMVELPGALTDATRARLALALGNGALASKVELTSNGTRTPEWIPYQLERALFEAKNGDRNIADAYLLRTVDARMDDRVLFTAEEVSRLFGDTKEAARYHQELLALANAPHEWTQTCATNELCTRALMKRYVDSSNPSIRITLSLAQSDQVPPYVELFVDDARAAEGIVRDETVFAVSAAPGLHRIELRLANPRTRNGIQRRVRLS